MISFLRQPIISFLFKAIVIWLLWLLVYGIMFKKDEINDPITLFEANITSKVFNLLGYNVSLSNNESIKYLNFSGEETIFSNKQFIIINNKPIIAIESACNGLELFALFLGFLIAFGGRKKLTLFLILGLASIFVLNTIRIIAITWISMFDREQANFHHHYTFMFIIYGYILWLWYKWTVIQSLNQNVENEK
jgi:exosortase/archaeosortase family protein